MDINIYFEEWTKTYFATYDDDEPDDDGRMAYGTGDTPKEAELDLLETHPRDGD